MSEKSIANRNDLAYPTLHFAERGENSDGQPTTAYDGPEGFTKREVAAIRFCAAILMKGENINESVAKARMAADALFDELEKNP